MILKTQEELANMSADEINKYQVDLKAFEKSEMETSVKSEVKTATETLKDFLTTEIEGKIAEMKTTEIIDFTKVFTDALVEKHDEIKAVQRAGAGVVEIKVPANITTANGVLNTPPNLVGTDLARLTNVNLRDIGILPYTNNLNTSVASYPYTEAKPKDGNYEFLAEGAIKPQIDFTWETNFANPVKTAAWMRLTTESIQDVVGLESIARDFLAKKHNLKKSKGILFGTGLNNEPKGATVYGRTFVAGEMALSLTNPNFMDVVNAAITDIATTHNYEDETPYMANFVAINPVDFFKNLVSAKDGDGKPLYPTATLFNMVNIGGVTIWADESIPAGKIFVADMSKYNTTNYVRYTVKIGYINDDFIKNQFVILGESRFHAFVKKLDEQAFIYDDIVTIKNAISTI